jgi:hypothetical protein
MGEIDKSDRKKIRDNGEDRKVWIGQRNRKVG